MQANPMQANSNERQSLETTNSILGVTSGLIDGSRLAGLEESACQGELSHFHGHYASCMEVYADAQTVMQYMDAHRDWFHRCAHPMKVEALGNNGYALTIGRFGAFGYEVEPKIGLDLLPQDQGIYCIQTIPVPNYEAPGYSVDFQAFMHLVESQADANTALPVMTRVEWELNLEVAIHFPRFIQALPKSMVQATGDRLLNQIVRQVSRRLTHKVQEDFHNSLGIAFPGKAGKKQH